MAQYECMTDMPTYHTYSIDLLPSGLMTDNWLRQTPEITDNRFITSSLHIVSIIHRRYSKQWSTRACLGEITGINSLT